MSNAEQIEYWNGDAGKRWAQQDATMERLLRPITEALLAHANIEGCSNALDVGCGGGSQSMILAERLGANAKVLGVDISEPMLRVARKKSEEQKANQAQVEFLQADAPMHRGLLPLPMQSACVQYWSTVVSAILESPPTA